MGFGLFVGAVSLNLYVFVLQKDRSVPAVLEKAKATSQVALGEDDLPNPLVDLVPPDVRRAAATRAGPTDPLSIPVLFDETEETREARGAVRTGESLSTALHRLGLGLSEATTIIETLHGSLDFRAVKPGDGIVARWSRLERLQSFDYRPASGALIRAARDGRGRWRVSRDQRPLRTTVVAMALGIDGTLHSTLRRAGETEALVPKLAEILSFDLDLYSELLLGDELRIVVEKERLASSFYRYGRVLALEYKGDHSRLHAYWFRADGVEGYFDQAGRPLARSLLRSPLCYVRLSAAVEPRELVPMAGKLRSRIPVLEYPAAIGTPVWALGAGRVTFRGEREGQGNVVVVTHAATGLESSYFHLGRIARGLRLGSQVHQHQLLGFVGRRSPAVGPRLPLAFRQGGKYLDPTRVRGKAGTPLPSRLLPELAARIAPLRTALGEASPGKAGRELRLAERSPTGSVRPN